MPQSRKDLNRYPADRLESDALTDAEKFLAKLLSKKYNEACASFNEPRVKSYFHAHEKKLIDLPCTSDAIQQNIKRAYLQTRIWLESPFLNAADRIDAQDYGFNFNAERNILEPCMFLGPQKTYRHA